VYGLRSESISPLRYGEKFEEAGPSGSRTWYNVLELELSGSGEQDTLRRRDPMPKLERLRGGVVKFYLVYYRLKSLKIS
jgi:hypothetical protein